MKKTLVFCLFALVLSLSLVLAFQTYILKVKVQTANVRSEPDQNSAVIRTLPLGTILESSLKIGEWFEIIVDDGSGNKISAFVSASVVNVISGEESPAPPAKPRVQTRQQPAAAPVYQEPTGYVAPKAYSGGGIRVLGGLTSSNISYDKSRLAEEGGGKDFDQYFKSRVGPMLGVGYESGSRFSFEFNVMYMPKGVKFQGQYDATAEGGQKVDFDVNMVFNEISIPVFFKMKILPGSTPFIFGGGEVGYILSSKASSSVTTNGKTETDEQDLLNPKEGESSINRIDFGLVLGGGYEMNMGGMKLTIEARYHMGLANLLKQTPTSEGEGVKSTDYFRSKALVILAGVKF
jgi:hypothetical protein